MALVAQVEQIILAYLAATVITRFSAASRLLVAAVVVAAILAAISLAQMADLAVAARSLRLVEQARPDKAIMEALVMRHKKLVAVVVALVVSVELVVIQQVVRKVQAALPQSLEHPLLERKAAKVAGKTQPLQRRAVQEQPISVAVVAVAQMAIRLPVELTVVQA